MIVLQLYKTTKFMNLLSPDLLEKARVISQQTLERSYHIFYQMMSGAVESIKSTYIDVVVLSNFRFSTIIIYTSTLIAIPSIIR